MKKHEFQAEFRDDIISFQSQKSLLSHVYEIAFWSSLHPSFRQSSTFYNKSKKRGAVSPEGAETLAFTGQTGDSKAHRAPTPSKG